MIHEVQQAMPITLAHLEAISQVVKIHDQTQLAIWCAVLFGFFMFLWGKSNLVPNSQVHTSLHQLSCKDIKLDGDLMLVLVKWSKTNRFGEKIQYPIMERKDKDLCLLMWLKWMAYAILGGPNHNLFSYYVNGKIIPITYSELLEQLKDWLMEIGVEDPKNFSSHSLRWGRLMHAFKNKVAEKTIKLLGNWASDCYK